MIVPMKKAILFALKSDRDSLLMALQQCGEMMIIPAQNAGEPFGKDQVEQEVQRVKGMLGVIKRYQGKQSLFAVRPEVDYAQFLTENPQTKQLEQEVENIASQLSSQQTQEAALRSQMEQYAPWLLLDIPVDQLRPTKYAVFHTGYGATSALQAIEAAAQENGAHVQVLGSGSEGQAILLTCHRDYEDAMMDAVKAQGFTPAALPNVDGLISDAYKSCEEKLSEISKSEETLIQRLSELAKRKQELEMLYDQYKVKSERMSVSFTETQETFYLEGWVRSDRMDKVQKAVAKVTDAYDLTFYDPQEGENPPTVTKNNRFISQFETITDMFSRPEPGGIDPNPVMGPWYWIIFGLMMGDAGYGLMMLVLIGAFIKLKKPRGEFGKLVNVLFLSSFTTILWGVLFGSYFGETWHPILFVPLDNPVQMLVFCLVIGVLHIFSGMILKMYDDIRQGHFWDAIFDQLSWMVLITGLGLLFLPATQKAGAVMAIAGAVVILFTAGRSNKNIFGKMTGGLLGLYNITSYMSDILSYSRILALSLATGVVGMVMNLLAGMVQGSIIGFILSLLIYIVGHVFNLAMGLLSAYVHDSRLQYIEFFNKFYDGGGTSFVPLSINTEHVDVVSSPAEK